MALNPKDRWYVAFDVPQSERLVEKRASPRATQLFENETEAKEFARTKFAMGLSVTAGTINPHFPKRRISSKLIPGWFDEKTD